MCYDISDRIPSSSRTRPRFFLKSIFFLHLEYFCSSNSPSLPLFFHKEFLVNQFELQSYKFGWSDQLVLMSLLKLDISEKQLASVYRSLLVKLVFPSFLSAFAFAFAFVFTLTCFIDASQRNGETRMGFYTY